ncbi:MAG: L-threonine 3-dehydrogenase [Verrucomicrobiota bacterium]|jgi:threonine 3-dehydrogenase
MPAKKTAAKPAVKVPAQAASKVAAKPAANAAAKPTLSPAAKIKKIESLVIPKTMKAISKKFKKEGLTLVTVPVPEIGVDDVLIKVDRTGICGTDVHIYKWDEWAQKTIPAPMVVGHEFVGVVVKKGANVHDIQLGDIVSAEGHVVCGICRNCRAGRFHLCRADKGIGVTRQGAFAEYVSVPKTNVWIHAQGINPDVMSIFDPYGNATHTALSFPVLGEDVLITGAGPIGAMAAGIVRHAGARNVVITDTNDYRLGLAKKMGKNIRTVNILKEKLDDVMDELNMTEGFDVGLEMSGVPVAFQEMVEKMANGGKIAILGIPSSGTSINWNRVIFKGLTLRGIYGRQMWETWYMMTTMLQSGFSIDPIITHRFAYSDFEKGFQEIFTGKSGKVVLSWSNAIQELGIPRD